MCFFLISTYCYKMLLAISISQFIKCVLYVGLHFVISESNKRVFADVCEVRKGTSSISIPLQHNVALTGDIRVDFFNRPKMKRKVDLYICTTILLIYLLYGRLMKLLRFCFSGKDVSFLVQHIFHPRENQFRVRQWRITC
jgi:hypothetical protein